MRSRGDGRDRLNVVKESVILIKIGCAQSSPYYSAKALMNILLFCQYFNISLPINREHDHGNHSYNMASEVVTILPQLG